MCHHGRVVAPDTYDVLVVTYNHAETLSACLAAVAALEPSPTAVVVVDNASCGGSAEVVRSWQERLPLRLIAERTNSGFAAALNRALRATRSPWALSLNPDCAPRPEFVRRLLAAAAALGDGRTGAVTGRLLRGRGPGLEPEPVLDAAGMEVTASGRHLDRGGGEPAEGRFLDPAWVFGGTAAATLYRRSALADVAYPDGQVLAESFFAYREDAELAWRLQWRGWSCLYVADAVAVHRRGLRPEEGRTGQPLVNRHSVRNRFLLRAHCADLGWHLARFPWWLLRDLLVVGACLTVETSSLAGLGQLWRLRRQAASRRGWVLGRATAPSAQVRRWFR
jgi:GT2 family glycosyltransferase